MKVFSRMRGETAFRKSTVGGKGRNRWDLRAGKEEEGRCCLTTFAGTPQAPFLACPQCQKGIQSSDDGCSSTFGSL